MSNTKLDVLPIISEKLDGFEDFAKRFAESRFLVATSEYGSNAEETAALEQIAENIVCNLSTVGNGFSLNVDIGSNNHPYLNIIQEGMDAPLTGGDNGYVTLPDGSTRLSNVPEQLWGNPLPEYAKVGMDVVEEIRTMLTDLLVDQINDAVAASKEQIAQAARTHISQAINNVIKR